MALRQGKRGNDNKSLHKKYTQVRKRQKDFESQSETASRTN